MLRQQLLGVWAKMTGNVGEGMHGLHARPHGNVLNEAYNIRVCSHDTDTPRTVSPKRSSDISEELANCLLDSGKMLVDGPLAAGGGKVAAV